MSEPKPEYRANEQAIDTLLAARADLISAILEIERLAEAQGKTVESVIITRQSRRNLTKRTRKRNI